MDFHELEAFAALANHLHFARAAAAVNTSPSALSRIIGRLEQEMGAALVARDTRSVALTEAGSLFLSFALESLRGKDALHLRLGSVDGRLRGTLRVYASVTACYSILPPLAAVLKATHPDLRLSVETGDPADGPRILKEGRVELALAALNPLTMGGLEGFSVEKTPLVFVTARDGEFGAWGEGPIRAQTLRGAPLILPSRGLARERFDDWARSQDLRPLIAAETSGNEAVLALARLGLGLGLVPRLVLENSPFAQGLVQYNAGADLGDYDIGFLLPAARTGGQAALAETLRELLERAYPAGRWSRG